MGIDAASVPRVHSASQRLAIEGPPQPLLVLAGPGAGKTFCLIERIGFLIDKLDIKPERICVFTFTNKAAGEIAERLVRELGPRVERVKRGTIHAFCADSRYRRRCTRAFSMRSRAGAFAVSRWVTDIKNSTMAIDR